MLAQSKIFGYYFIDEVLTDDIISTFKKNMPNFYHFPADSHLTDRITLSQLHIGSKITAMERNETFELLSQKLSTTIYTGSDTSHIPQLRNMGLAKTLTEMPLIFHESKINLNTTAKSIRSGIPLRIWDIMASGGFVLSNYQPEIPTIFSVGNEIDIYSSMEELLEKCNFYLTHDNERREIANTGYETICKHHTYPIRLSQILDIAFSF